MGVLERLSFAYKILTAETVVLPPTRGDVAQVEHLPSAVAEAFGINVDSDHVTRRQAMAIPAVRRGRQVIAGTLGAAPLVCMRTRAGKPPERVDRMLLAQPDPNVTRTFTFTWTIDDLIFYGVSFWLVLERDAQGYPVRAARIEPHRIRIDRMARRVYIDSQPVDDRDLIRFDGPDEGILWHGARTLKTYLLLEDAVRKYARLDVPLGLLLDEQGSLESGEAQTLLDQWEAARRARTTGYLPKGLKYQNPNFNAEQLQLADARAFQSAEIARLLNLPAQAVNAPTNDSLTYATTESNRRELVDLTFSSYMAPIGERLSMPDVTPLGQTVSFDLAAFIRGDLKDVISTGATAVSAGLMTADEVRAQWLNLPPLPMEGTAS